MVRPTIGRPRRCSIPATTELSTPPDMATAMVFSDTGGVRRRQTSQMRDRLGDGRDQSTPLLFVIRLTERESETRAGPFSRQSDSNQYVRWFDGAAGAS